MFRKFKNPVEEREWRAKRALLWCAFEGTEVQDMQVKLFELVESGMIEDKGTEALVSIMESQALSLAREYLEDQVWGWDDSQKQNFLLCMRHFRETGEIHPELAMRLNV